MIAMLLAGSAWAQPIRDGKLLINSTVGANSTAIAVVESDGQRKLLLEQKGDMLMDPSWAGDGGIFYVSAERAGKASELRWMQADGSGSKVVRKFPEGIVFQPSLAPDGKHLLFYVVETGEGGDMPQIWLADGDGSNAHPVGPRGACFPAWSPDSREFLAVLGSETRASLSVLDLEGKTVRAVLTNQEPFVTPAWSPDGQRIVLASINEGSKLSHLYSVDAQGKNLVQLTRGEDGAEMSPCFDAEGRLYYNRMTKASISVWTSAGDGQDAKQFVDQAAVQGAASLLWLTDQQESPR